MLLVGVILVTLRISLVLSRFGLVCFGAVVF